MIKLITGKRGTGKTKILIDAIHEAENKSNGNVVAIQKGSSLNTDITPKVRLINIEDYAVEGVDAFYGFVSGILASDTTAQICSLTLHSRSPAETTLRLASCSRSWLRSPATPLSPALFPLITPSCPSL